ncbi:MAG: GNAT family N-acetyltransferase [Rubrivivax sp.]
MAPDPTPSGAAAPQPAAPVNLQPTLTGPTLLLRPLAAGDFDALHAAAADPLVWALHPEPTRWKPEVFRRFFESGLACGGALLAIERSSGEVVGSSRYYHWKPEPAEITVGFTFLVRRLWGGLANREMKALMLGHAFGFARAIWFDVGVDNLRSRRAMEKLGGTLARETPADPLTGAAAHVHYRIERAAWLGGLAARAGAGATGS